MRDDGGRSPVDGRVGRTRSREPEPLLPIMRLALASWVRPEGLARRELVLGSTEGESWEVVPLDVATADATWRVLHLMDGQRTLMGIATEARLSLTRVSWVARELYQRAVLVQTGGLRVDALTYYEHLRSLASIARRRWGTSPMGPRGSWTEETSRRLTLGYLLESHHLVAAVAAHREAVVAAQATERGKALLSEGLSRESARLIGLKRLLLAAGLTEEELEQATPLSSMLALIEHLRWLGTEDALSYAACMGVGMREPDEGDDGDLREWMEPFADSGPLSATEQARIRQRLITCCRLTMAHHRELIGFYGAEGGPRVFTGE
ncbi:hypothetical protein MYSTI_00038 [Myxococcus stipitatus DSM 14675]|uniref:Uncharacterized protein n=1 Tax=Myxococcus stipitatus (strain DSM 14675 / JCM 12634 / Mx s8) TaxID=1278073 RepID=L7U1C9_MYXSD|nr:hypothetical protein MYSTI_00038 [Myxococcus stipitatus DSM 14675]